MLRLFLFTVLLAVNLFSYEVYVKTKADLLILNTLGIECQKSGDIFVCAKFDTPEKTQKFLDYISDYGVKAFVKYPSPPKTGYCIQVISSKKYSFIKKRFDFFKNYPFARIEKIGKYYVLRVAQNENPDALKSLYKKIKSKWKSSFLRKCDFITSRIVFPKGNFSYKKIKKFSMHDLYEKLPELYKEGKYEEVLFYTTLLQRSIYKKNVLFYKVKAYFKLKNYQKSCVLSQKLYQIYGDESGIKNLQNESCFLYYLNQAKHKIYTAPYESYSDIKKALSYKKNDKRALKTLAYIYYNIGDYENAYKYFKQTSLDKPSDYSMFAKTLFTLNKFDELNVICKNNNIQFCKDYAVYLKAKKLASQYKYREAYKTLYPVWQLYPEDKNLNYLLAYLSIKLNKIDEAVTYLNKVGDEKRVAKMLRDAYFNVNDIQKAYKYASMLSDDSEINKKIINAYLKYVAYNLYKKGKYDKALEILNSLDGDIEVMELKGKIYAALKDYSKAEKAFKEAYIYNNSPAVAKDLIELYFKQNKIQKAKNFTDFSNKELKDTYYLNLAKYYLSKKDIIQMNKALDNVSQKTPEYEYLRGVLCFYQQNYDCALKKLLKLKPSIERNYYLILTYLKLNKKTKAKELFDKTFKTYPKEYAKKVANIYIQLGEIEKAKKILGY